jgi:hypothetical protein
VHLDPEQAGEVRVGGLGVGELIALPVGGEDEAEHGQRLVAARVDELDERVGVAVGLQIGPGRVRPMERVGGIGGGVKAPQ